MLPNKSKIHAICLVKNEVDVIQYALQQAIQWADFIYVYDNGSTDGTWEAVQEIANAQIIPWKQDAKPFQESLRGEVFNAFKHRANPGDWWCRLDSDEFYVQSPKEFLAKVPRTCHVVWGIAIEYYLSQDDVHSLNFQGDIANLLPALRLYKAENSEARFFRHRDQMTWLPEAAWPNHMGIVYPERILYKHYKYRSPQQIQKRLETRQKARERGFPGWDHATAASWQETLVNPADLQVDHQDGQYHVSWNKLPNHLESPSRRLLKYIMHGTKLWS
jgi:hypothetical protein